MLRCIGQNHDRQKRTYIRLMAKNKIIAYDTSALFTHSPGIKMGEFGHNNNNLTLPMVKIIWDFQDSGMIHTISSLYRRVLQILIH